MRFASALLVALRGGLPFRRGGSSMVCLCPLIFGDAESCSARIVASFLPETTVAAFCRPDLFRTALSSSPFVSMAFATARARPRSNRPDRLAVPSSALFVPVSAASPLVGCTGRRRVARVSDWSVIVSVTPAACVAEAPIVFSFWAGRLRLRGRAESSASLLSLPSPRATGCCIVDAFSMRPRLRLLLVSTACREPLLAKAVCISN